jgi:hypothetical protein
MKKLYYLFLVLLFGGSVFGQGIPCPENISVNNDPDACGAVVNYTLPKANILVNGDASQGLTGWTVLQQSGYGWGTGSGYFLTSYGDCPENTATHRKSQEIDLLAAGYSNTFLDNAPAIVVGERIVSLYPNALCSADPGDLYYVRYELRDASHNVIASYVSGTPASPMRVYGTPVDEEVTFTGYGPGVRYVYFEHGGADSGYWLGHYGSAFTDARVEVVQLPSLTAGLLSGAFFPVGTTTNSYEFDDGAGNVSTCSFTVTVNDNTPPEITIESVESIDQQANTFAGSYSLGDDGRGQSFTALPSTSMPPPPRPWSAHRVSVSWMKSPCMPMWSAIAMAH